VKTRISTLLTLCGAASALAAQPVIISGSGATLQQTFFEAAANTNEGADEGAEAEASES